MLPVHGFVTWAIFGLSHRPTQARTFYVARSLTVGANKPF